jgi:hypothetical protein
MARARGPRPLAPTSWVAGRPFSGSGAEGPPREETERALLGTCARTASNQTPLIVVSFTATIEKARSLHRFLNVSLRTMLPRPPVCWSVSCARPQASVCCRHPRRGAARLGRRRRGTESLGLRGHLLGVPLARSSGLDRLDHRPASCELTLAAPLVKTKTPGVYTRGERYVVVGGTAASRTSRPIGPSPRHVRRRGVCGPGRRQASASRKGCLVYTRGHKSALQFPSS